MNPLQGLLSTLVSLKLGASSVWQRGLQVEGLRAAAVLCNWQRIGYRCAPGSASSPSSLGASVGGALVREQVVCPFCEDASSAQLLLASSSSALVDLFDRSLALVDDGELRLGAARRCHAVKTIIDVRCLYLRWV